MTWKEGFPLATLLTLVVVAGPAPLSRAADEAEGKTLFMAKKCNLCHAIDSQGIAKKSEKMKGKELSNIGSEGKSADWLKGWLLQTELKEGEKHKKKFKGTDQEMKAITNWLLTLKTS